MITGQQANFIWHHIAGSMSEPIFGFPFYDSPGMQISQVAVESNLAQTHNDAHLSKALKLFRKVIGTIADFLWCGLVTRGRTTHHRSDPGVPQLKTIMSRNTLRLVRKANLVKNRIHKVSGTVTSERAPGTVRSMGARSQPQDQYACIGISEARDGSSPINLVLVCAPLCFSDALAILS